MPRRGVSKLLLCQKPRKQTGSEPPVHPGASDPGRPEQSPKAAQRLSGEGGFHPSSHHVYASIAPKFPVTDCCLLGEACSSRACREGDSVCREDGGAGASSPMLPFAVCPRDLALRATLPPAARPDPRSGTWCLAFTGRRGLTQPVGTPQDEPQKCSVLPGRVRALGR